MSDQFEECFDIVKKKLSSCSTEITVCLKHFCLSESRLFSNLKQFLNGSFGQVCSILDNCVFFGQSTSKKNGLSGFQAVFLEKIS